MDISAYQHMNIRMSTRGKRPLRNLTPSDKVRAIQRIHNGETKASVSRDIGVPESTLRGWCKNEQKLRFMCRQLNGSDQLSAIAASMDAAAAASSSSSSLPDKRNRFESHIKTPQFPIASPSSYDDYNFNRVAMNSLHYGTTGSNAILEKIALNEIMKKHGLPPPQPPTSVIDNGHPKKLSSSSSSTTTNALPSGSIGTMPLGSDFAQLSIMQNLNLLSLLNPTLAGLPTTFMPGNSAAHSTTACTTSTTAASVSNGGNYTNGVLGANASGFGDNIKSNTAIRPIHITADDMIIESPKRSNAINDNTNNSSCNSSNNNGNGIALSVKDWAKDPAKDDLNVTDKAINGAANNINIKSDEYNSNNKNDNNNNSVNDKHSNSNNNSNNNSSTNNTEMNQMSTALDITNNESLNFLTSMPFPFLQASSPSNITNATTAMAAAAAAAAAGIGVGVGAGAAIDSTENANAVILEWYKVFNASLNFLALATAAAALQPANNSNNNIHNNISNNIIASILNGNDNNNGHLINTINVNGNHHQQKDNNTNSNDSTEANILYKELTKNAKRQFEAITNNINNNSSTNNNNMNNGMAIQNLTNSDASNDSYFESEPEDLSVRSAATSKLSSPLNSYTQSPLPVKSSDSCSPQSVASDGDQ